MQPPVPLREFTVRGVLLGALITLAFTAANVYLGLKVGLTFASAIPAAVISMALLYRFKDSNILENNLVQTQASAAGTLSSVIFVLPGLVIMGIWSSFPFWQTALIAAGYLIGIAAGLAVLLGVVLCWFVVVPWLTMNATPDQGQTMIALATKLWNTKAKFLGAGAIGISALWAIVTLAGPIIAAIRSQPARTRTTTSTTSSSSNTSATTRSDETDVDMPRSWILIIGLIALSVLFLVVNHFIGQHMTELSTMARYGLSALCVLFAAVFGFLVAAACGYMAGLVGSSSSPISGIGIIATVLMGVSLLGLHTLVPSFESSIAGNLGVVLVLFMVSVILAMAAISNDNLQDLKTGYLVGATPWRQQVVLIIGCVVGALVIPPVLDLLYNAYGFAGALPRPDMDPKLALEAPQANLMKQIASGIFTGTLDWSMLGAGVLVGLAVIAADWALRKSERGSLPPLAVGLGIYLPPTIGVTLTIGAVLGYVIQRAIKSYGERNGKDWTKAAEERGLLLASGLIVGESLMGLLLAVVIGFSGSNSPLALVGDGFTAAPWLGMVFFVALIGIFYRRVLAK